MEGWQAIVASDPYIILTSRVPGFDRAGAKDLKKLVGSRKWIGTSGQDITVTVLTWMLTIPLDLWVAFTYLGIPYVSNFMILQYCGLTRCSAELVDFDLNNEPHGKLSFTKTSSRDTPDQSLFRSGRRRRLDCRLFLAEASRG